MKTCPSLNPIMRCRHKINKFTYYWKKTKSAKNKASRQKHDHKKLGNNQDMLYITTIPIFIQIKITKLISGQQEML